MGKKLTNEQFLQKLKDLGRTDVEPLEEYKGRHVAIKFKCTNPNCRHEWMAQPGNIYSGQGCPICSLKNKSKFYTKETFNEKLKEVGRFDVILIGEYINTDTSTVFKCTKCGHEWEASPSNILYNGYSCPICNYIRTGLRNKVTDKDFKEKVKELNPDIEAISEYKGRETPVTFKCSKGHIWESKPSGFYENPQCPYCNESTKKLIEGYNDLATVRPDLVKYFKDKELTKKIKPQSNKKVDLICPYCGHEKKMMVSNLYKEGFYCDICNDGISFPNKVIRNLLKDESVYPQINKLEFEWSPKWEKKVFFDSLIIVNNKIICIEMQGSQHQRGQWNGVKDISIKERDEYKRIKCKKEGIIEIEINCNDSSFEVIKNNIMKSELINYIDLSSVDWDKVAKNSMKSFMIEACNIYNNSIKSVSQIAEKIGVGRDAIKRYLEIGAKSGICIYTKEDSEFRGIFYKTKYKYEIYEQEEFLGTFYTINMATEFLNNKFPDKHFYTNLVNSRSKNGNIIDGLKIIRSRLTKEDKKIYEQEYLKEKKNK